MPPRPLLRAAWATALGSACAAPPSPPSEPGSLARIGPADVLLVTLDTTRADRLGAYGDPGARTPHLDGLARQAVLFRDAFAVAPLTLPSHASIMTGRWPHEHGARDNGVPLDGAVPTVAEGLAGAGYHTAAFVSAYVLDSTWGLARGFEVYADGFHPEDVAAALSLDSVERPAAQTVDRAVAWWRATDPPRMAWVHLFDAHAPYVPPEDWPAGGDPYRGEVFAVDRAIGRLLELAGDDAWVIVAGDHGESLWDDGEHTHGLILNRSVLRVPLLIRPPGGATASPPVPARQVPARPPEWAAPAAFADPHLQLDATPDAPAAARVYEPPVSIVDLAPTLLDIAGLPCDGCAGRSLMPAATGAGADEQRVILAETRYPRRHYGWAPAMAALKGDRLLVRRPEPALFDRVADPWLRHPLDEPPDADLEAALAPYAAPADVPAGDLAPDVRSALEALGYLTGPAPAVSTEAPLPDVRERIDVLRRLATANQELQVAPARAQATLERIVAEEPGLADAWTSLGLVRLLQRDVAGALAAHRQAAALSPDSPLVLQNVVVTLRAAGNHAEALALADALAERWPGDPRWHRFRADLGGRLERPAVVRDACRDGLAVAGDDPYLHYMLGLSLLQLGDPRAALTALDAAATNGTRAKDIELWRGQAHRELGEVDAAVDAWRRQLVATPDDLRPLVAAALLLASEGRCDDAIPYLVDVVGRGVRTREIQQAAERCRPRPAPPG